MLAVGVYRFGGPDVLEVLERPDPHPEPREVRVRVRAATVNPTDTLLRQGRQRPTLEHLAPPYTPGMELAGEVDEVGRCSRWHVGDHVMAVVVPSRPSGGAYAQYVVVSDDSAVAVPPHVSFEEAATVPMNGLTATKALEALGLDVDSVVLVTGAAGAVGGYSVQLARAAGHRVVADASEADEALIRRLGADEVVRRGSDAPYAIRRLYPDGVDGVVDTALLGGLVVPAVRDGGRIALLRRIDVVTDRDITTHVIGVRDHVRERTALEQLAQKLTEGSITPRLAMTLPFERAAEAHERLEAGGLRGRIVLVW